MIVLTGLKAEGLLVEKMKPKKMGRIRAIGCNFPQLRNTVGIRLRARGDDFQHQAKALSHGIGADVDWKVCSMLSANNSPTLFTTVHQERTPPSQLADVPGSRETVLACFSAECIFHNFRSWALLSNACIQTGRLCGFTRISNHSALSQLHVGRVCMSPCALSPYTLFFVIGMPT